MDPASACAIGMIPAELKDKITPIGNAAGEGAKIALLNRKELEASRTITENIEFMELADTSDFQKDFIGELNFPKE